MAYPLAYSCFLIFVTAAVSVERFSLLRCLGMLFLIKLMPVRYGVSDILVNESFDRMNDVRLIGRQFVEIGRAHV